MATTTYTTGFSTYERACRAIERSCKVAVLGDSEAFVFKVAQRAMVGAFLEDEEGLVAVRTFVNKYKAAK